MKKEELFEALGEISSRTVQRNTEKRYRERTIAGYIRLVTVAAAILAVGTILYVFRIADSTHGIKEGILQSGGIKAGEPAYMTAEEAAPAAEEPVMEASEELADGAYVSETDDYEKSSAEMPVEEAAEDVALSENAETPQQGDFELNIKFPENENWIKLLSRNINGNRLEISYKDLIAEADCILMGVRDGELDLPGIDYGNSKALTREYVYTAAKEKKDRLITVKQSEDKKDVLITWEYEEYKFAVIGKLNGKNTDTSAIEKTVYYIIDEYLRLADANMNSAGDTPSHTENAE